jgi:hypothetical protein
LLSEQWQKDGLNDQNHQKAENQVGLPVQQLHVALDVLELVPHGLKVPPYLLQIIIALGKSGA